MRLEFCDDPAFKGQFELLTLEKEQLEVAGEGKTIIIQLVERKKFSVKIITGSRKVNYNNY